MQSLVETDHQPCVTHHLTVMCEGRKLLIQISVSLVSLLQQLRFYLMCGPKMTISSPLFPLHKVWGSAPLLLNVGRFVMSLANV